MGSEEVKRTCCLIVDNMCKVVEDPAAVVPVMPRLEPLVKAACEKMGDPEARAVAERALATMRKAAEGSELKTVSAETAAEMLKAVCGDKMTSDAELFLPYVASLAASATNMRSYKPEAWKKSVALCEPFGDVIDDVRSKLELASKPAEEVEEEDTEGVDLYKGAFSLAYGTLTLLRDAKMHLKRNRFYGLLGPNQCGKTTLMRAIVNEQLDGFPKRDELKSVFVEHEIEDEEVGVQDDGFPILSVDKPGWWWVQYTVNDVYKKKPKDLEKKLKDGKKSKLLSEEEVWELEDKIAELKEQVAKERMGIAPIIAP